MQATTMTSTTALPLDFGASGADPQQLRSIPLDAIHIETDFPVRRLDAEALDALAKSLEIVGQLQPIGVRAVGKSWSLIYGERRLRAARLLGWSALLARVYSPIGAVPVVLRATENMHRQEFGLEDAADTVLRLVEAGMSPQSIAKALARSDGWVTSVLGIARNPLARELVELGRVQSASAWESFAALTTDAQRIVVESSDTITVGRCDEARQAVKQREERRQRSLTPPAVKEPPAADQSTDGERILTCQDTVELSCAAAGPVVAYATTEHDAGDDVLILGLSNMLHADILRNADRLGCTAQQLVIAAIEAYITRLMEESGHV
jgi:ParB family chromosome partitioning protein